MIAKCDKCNKMFDSHEGGTIKKRITYCPQCEEEFLNHEYNLDKALSSYENNLDSTSL
jgi:NAD-dependent SIR2 family protein deacetylase